MWEASCPASCCAACACEMCKTVVGSIGCRSARIAYCNLFASWALHEVAVPLLQSIPWINHFHKTPNHECFETDAVLRVSLGNFLFFTILASIMASIKDYGGWMFCLVVIIFLMFFMPNSIVSL